MRSTSLEALAYITDTGILGRERTRCYEILFHHGPLAQFEFADFERDKHYGYTLSKRVSELVAMGLVQPVGVKVSPSTNRRCLTWDVTPKIPTTGYKGRRKKVRPFCPLCGRKNDDYDPSEADRAREERAALREGGEWG